MISEERLKELNKQNIPIYFINKPFGVVKLLSKDYSLGISYMLTRFGIVLNVKDLYETKEEAEFVAKYHCSKTIKFKPPTFEEFIKTRTEHCFANWESNDIQIIMVGENDINGIKTTNFFEVNIWFGCDYEKEYFNYEYNEFEDTRKQVYYQAVEYAKKLFLGEENAK